MTTLLHCSLLTTTALLLACSNPHLVVRVIVPPGTPPESQVFIAGNSPALGDWNAGRVLMRKSADSVWEYALDVEMGAFVEFKITRGSWNRQAVYQQGVIPPNTQVAVSGDTLIELRPVSWSDKTIGGNGGVTGTVRYHRGLQGEGLSYARDLVVWLPPSYADRLLERYAVLYMHDGQNVFDPSTSFIGYDWHADEVADSLIRAGAIDPPIIVGITNSADRLVEYADTEKGRAYARFVVQRVKPLIDSTYRTKPDRGNTAVMGSSMGGLISFLFVRWHPDVFSKAACLSSVFDRRASTVFEAVEADRGPKSDVRIYMDCGGRGGEGSLKPGMEEMFELLKIRGYKEGNEIVKYYDPTADHSERAWAARLWRPMVFLFGKDVHQ